jgi:CRP/FNR family transcriptional regulator, cyclic AMP receptor protein
MTDIRQDHQLDLAARITELLHVIACHVRIDDLIRRPLRQEHLLTRNNRVEADLIDQLFNSSEKRLARLLLSLAIFGKEGRPEPIAASFDQGTLAEMIGTTRSRVSSFMNKFRKLGFISYNGRIEVHRSLLNAVLQERPHIDAE